MLKFVKQVDISFNPLHPKAEVVRQLFARITSPRAEASNPNVKFNLVLKPFNEGEPKVEYTFINGVKKSMDVNRHFKVFFNELALIRDRMEMGDLIKEMDTEKDEDISQYLRPPEKKAKPGSTGGAPASPSGKKK